MYTIKRFGLAALLVLATALSASTPVQAQSTITLTNVAGSKDSDSGASGQATLTDVAYSFTVTLFAGGYSMTDYDFYAGYLTVSCSGLTPGATYRIGPTSFGWAVDGTTLFPIYSSVTASDTGTVDLALRVLFVGSASEWEIFFPEQSGSYWVKVGTYQTTMASP
jgi:hypothetical protein